ncbi:MAG: glutamate formimidoyltransferase [Vulcanimicrobiota bacterium]
MEPVFQCIPNLSEGRRPELLLELAERLTGVEGVHLADHSWDRDHHRAVYTLLGSADPLRAAMLEIFDWASQHLDLEGHQGEHPRVGAIDVVPFVPVWQATMEQARELAVSLAEAVAERHQVPVFLYEEAARKPEHRLLPELRRGGLEGLRLRLAHQELTPDLGPAQLHPRLGATVIGARGPLLAYNIVLGTDKLEIAQAIARRIREGGGGLVSVRALGVSLEHQGRVQVSMNLTRPLTTGFYQAFEMVKVEARRHGVTIESSELIGLCPLEALAEVGRYYLQLNGFRAEQVLEHQLLLRGNYANS